MAKNDDDMMGLNPTEEDAIGGSEPTEGPTEGPTEEVDSIGDSFFGADRGKEAPEAPEAPETPETPSSTGTTSVRREASKPLSDIDKAFRVMLRRAGIESAPPIGTLMRGKGGEMMAIKDIGIFIKEPEDSALRGVSKGCPIPNTVNLSAHLVKNQVLKVGSQILSAGKMYQPIHVARITEDESVQCTSGRHRLAFLALIYGPDVEIPVYVEEMSLNEARDAVVVANQARSAKAMERADHTILQAVGGNLDAEQGEIYKNTAITKARAKKYCVFSVLNRGYPAKLDFKVSLTSSRKDGGMTTLTNVENFWGAALHWDKDVQQKEFDAALKSSVEFVNAVVSAMRTSSSFNAPHHLSSMALAAIGKWYKEYASVTGEDGLSRAEELASNIVEMGEIGRERSDAIYRALAKAMSK